MFPFLHKFFLLKIKKFSKNFYNTLIFSTKFSDGKEKVFQNDFYLAEMARKSGHYDTAILIPPLHYMPHAWKNTFFASPFT